MSCQPVARCPTCVGKMCEPKLQQAPRSLQPVRHLNRLARFRTHPIKTSRDQNLMPNTMRRSSRPLLPGARPNLPQAEIPRALNGAGFEGAAAGAVDAAMEGMDVKDAKGVTGVPTAVPSGSRGLW